MPLSFDDLIPQGTAPPISAPPSPASGGLSFDDLIPQKEEATAQTAPVKPSIGAMALYDIAKVPSNIYSGIKDLLTLPGDVYQGNAVVPQSANMPGGEQTSDIGRTANFALGIAGPSEVGGPTKAVPFKGPSEAALDASKTARYESPAIKDLQLKPEAGEDISNIIKTDLKQAKLDQFNAREHYEIADRLKNPRFGDNLTIDDLEAARRDAQVEPTAKPNAKRASGVVRDAIDNYLGNIPENHVLSGDAAAANDALLKARADTAALKRSEEVTNALGRAANRAPAVNSGRNFDNLTRQQLTPILDKKTGVAKTRGFEDYTPEEITALQNTIDPGWLVNRARDIRNKLGGGGGVGGTHTGVLGFLGAEHFGADPLTAAAIGYGINKVGQGFGSLANRLAYSRVNQLADLLRQRSALADEMRAAGPQRQALSPLWIKAPMLGLGGSQ